MRPQGHLRQHQPIIGFLQQLTDAVIIFLGAASVLSYFDIPITLEHYLASLLGAFSFFMVGHYNHLYSSWRSQSFSFEIKELLRSWAVSFFILLPIGYISGGISLLKQPAVFSWFVLTPIALISVRVSARAWLRYLRTSGRNTRRIAIAGADGLAIKLASVINENPWMGIHIAGFYDDLAEVGDVPDISLGYRVEGKLPKMVEQARTGEFDEIYIALPMKAEERMKYLVQELSDCAIPVNVVPNIFTFNLLNSRVKDVGGLPAISIQDSPHGVMDRVLKRTEDIFVSLGILSVAIWPMLLIALAVKLTSSGPILFKQRRYGRNGEQITIWKFRTMSVCEDGDDVPQASKGDVRITKIGAFLRKTSLDELPQFFNVLQGQMSIVGPRPHAVAHNEFYRRDIPGYMQRHLVKPGITGWAQVNGWRGETATLDKMEKRVQYDLEYIRNWSLLFDFKIIFLTVINGFIHKNAY